MLRETASERENQCVTKRERERERGTASERYNECEREKGVRERERKIEREPFYEGG